MESKKRKFPEDEEENSKVPHSKEEIEEHKLEVQSAFATKLLPPEILVKIFNYLSFDHVVENCSKTCIYWNKVVIQYFLHPYLCNLASYSKNLKDLFQESGWSKDFDFEYGDVNIIATLYEKFKDPLRTYGT